MAITKMEKLSLSFGEEHLDRVLELMQGFQGIHIESGYESSVPPAKKAAVDTAIRDTEKNIQDIQAALSILMGRESARVSGLLRDAEEKSLTLSELTAAVEETDWEKILDEVIQTDRMLQDNRKKRRETSRLLNELRFWDHLSYDPLDFNKLRRTKALVGSVHQKHAEEFTENLVNHEDDGLYFEHITEDAERAYFFIVFHNSFTDQLNVYLSEFSFSEDLYPFDKKQSEARAELDADEAALVLEEREIDKQIIEQAVYGKILAYAEDYNLNILIRLRKSLEVIYEPDEVIINGWIISDMSAAFEQTLQRNLPADGYRLTTGPVRDRDIDEVPIKLKNGRLVSVYEQLTEMFSLPRYDELDPTPIMTIFYFIFYGMMVADVGYGLAIFLVGGVIKKFFAVKQSTKKLIDFLFYLSVPIMGWGFVYGSFCGMTLPFGLISATVDIIPMTLLSIALGYFHVMAGLVMNIINKFKHKQYFDMINGGLSWFTAFLGGGVLIVSAVAPFPALQSLSGVGAVLTGAGVAMVLITPAVESGKRWLLGFGKGLYALYGATSYFGDFISYARLMALGVAGGSVALAFNTIISFLPPIVRFSLGIVLAVILHALNMFLSMLSAYVHGIRLQFIEFFGRFYTGGGRKFEAFKAAEKNVIISDAQDQ